MSLAIGRGRAAVVGIVVAIAAIPGLHAALASAGTSFTVDSTSDALDARAGDGACRTMAGSCTLRAAIQEANALPGPDVIEVPAGTYELRIPPLNQNDVTTGDLDITDSLEIRGTGAGSTIVDGGTPVAGAPPQVHGLDRLFEVAVDGGAVSFSGLTLSDGYAAEYGGAVMNNSTATVTVTGVTMTGNVAGKTGGAIDNHLGGALEVRGSTVSGNFANESGSAVNNNRDGSLTVTDSTISANSAAAIGLDEELVGAGAIANKAELDARGTISVSGSDISGNRAGGGRSGATISNDGAGSVAVDRTTFTKNRATGDGGAIFNGSGEVTITDSAFSENEASDGGAVYNVGVNGGRVAVSRSTFTLNAASGRGGAIVSAGTGVLTVLDSTFAKNSAEDWGGAILNDDKGGATIVNSVLRENSGLNGGGFANEGTELVTVESSTFTKNTAFSTAVLASGEGGGMHSNSVGEVAITGGAFTENQARSGGGLSNEGGGQVTVTGTLFSTNSADEQGGGILIQSGAVSMVDIDVIGNVANAALEGGGGIAYEGDKLVGLGESAAIEDSRIRDNKAKGLGGGIDSRGDGPLALTTTAITGNTAATGGGIHHVGDAPLEVTRSTLSSNFAEHGGGVFSDGDGEAAIENSTISGNRAGQFGGGLLVSSRLTIRSSTVAGNAAASGGGINNGGGDLVGDGSVFLANTIVADSPTGGNCAGTMTSRGGNVDSADSCGFRELSDQPGTNPRLGPLADNGGPTQTHALLAESPAQERAVCTDLDPCPAVDQRGVERPLFVGVDVGAYESPLTPGGGVTQPCSGRTERPVPADFDSWISQSAPAVNAGGDATLKVESKLSANERALLHFSLPSLPPGCKLVGATLRLYAASATAGSTLEAVRVTSEWSETGVTWGNQPATAGPAATSESGLGVREWDVLAQTLDTYALGGHGFLLRDAAENETGEQTFHSREKGTDRPPVLVLVFDDPDAEPRPGSCPTTPQSLSADRDSWVSEGSPSNNFGSDSTLKVKSQLGYNSRALIRFPLPALPPGCTGVASAALRLEAASAKDGRTLEALQVADGWSESGVTWSSQPATTGLAATTQSAEGPLEWAVTPQVLDMYVSGNHGFLIRDADENGVGDEQTLHSRDKLNDSPPDVVLTFDDSTPETTIDSGPRSPTDESEALFTFSSDRADATFECSLDGAEYLPCSSPHAVRRLAEGGHSFAVRSTRKVRAVDPTPATYDWTVAIPPETTVAGPASPSASSSATLTVSSDDPDATFECSLNGQPFAACTSPVEYTNLADGRQEVRVRAVDALGSVDPTPATHVWTVADPPETTIDSGPSDPSNSPVAAFAFSADEAATFECRLDGGEWVACVSGHEYRGLADGRHEVQVRATDAAGNADPEPAAHAWTVDTRAPEATIDSGPSSLTNERTATFAFSADEAAAFECRLDAGEWASCTSPVEYANLADGQHELRVQATDRAGNRSAVALHAWTVDTQAPETTIGSGPADPTNERSAAFEFGASEAASFECRLDAGEWVACTSGREYPELAEGRHTFSVQATDAAGNREEVPASYSWTVDTLAPETTIGSAPADPSSDRSPTFVFGADEAGASFECRLDAGEWVACESGREYFEFADGRHGFDVRATDRAGNADASPASHAWTVDTVAPETTIESGPDDPTKERTATVAFAADEAAGFECRLDAGAWASCTSPAEYGDLADGRHTVAVRATDRAGNAEPEPAVHEWTVDTVAPETTIDSGPAELTNERSAAFAFTADDAAGFECRLDGGAWVACATGHEYRDLADGPHEVQVRATDPAGNVEATPASYAWTVDTVAPETTIDAAPTDPTNQRAASFEFSADERDASFECRLDAGAWEACAGGREYVGLADGRHTFSVQATDAAGNREAAPASHGWTVDTVAPETTIDSAPPELAKSASASFAFSAEAGAGFECRLDAGEWVACASGRDYRELADGRHDFAVRAIDAAGNVDLTPATYTWTVDTRAPQTTIDSGPPDPTNERTARVAFSADEAAGLECRLDAGEWVACTSPVEYTNLADGRHEVQVRATDRAGNVDLTPAAHGWTVDTRAPETTIESGPPDPSNSAAAAFAFGADEGASFECRLDAGEWVACTSPVEYANLGDGGHEVAVRATDRAGNVDETPASHTWTIDTVAPETTIDSRPADLSSSASASFALSAEAGASLECRLDAGEWVACTSPVEYTSLADGPHQLAVRATDRAGNVDATPASYSWTIDTRAPETTIDSAPADPTDQSSAAFAFSADEAGASFECRLDAGEWLACSSGREYLELAEGRHTFSVQATDGAGNREADPASYSWTIDVRAPETTIESGPADPSNDRSPVFRFGADEGASFECRLDAGDWVACTSPVEYTSLADGPHSFAARATDGAGNVDLTPATYAWTIDTRAPQTTIDSGPPDPSKDSSAAFVLSADEVGAFECRLDAGQWVACTSPVEYADLTDGRHALDVRATDRAGNTDLTHATHAWTIDTVAPETTIDAAPADPTNNRAAVFAFSAGEAASFECRLDAGEWLACASGREYVDLAEGRHTFSVQATDGAGNREAGPASHAWTVDTRAPETRIDSAPADPSNDRAPAFAFGADESASFECRVDAGAWAPCATGQSHPDLADGPHSFAVRATDRAGNTDLTPATYTWTVDTTAPDTELGERPPASTASTSARFTFSAGEPVAFECALDAEAFASCTSPQEYAGLAAGGHEFRVRATDAAGNIEQSPASHRWTVESEPPRDTSAPDTAITARPADPTNSTSATFSFTGSDDETPQSQIAFQCRLDSGAETDFRSCSSPTTYSALGQGSHTFEVRAVDLAGNTDPSPATYVWTLDTLPPQTTIGAAPAPQTDSTRAGFAFSANEPASSFECSLDGAAFAACTSPREYTGLAAGPHQFSVRAKDPAGNTDPTPANHTWTISAPQACGPETTVPAAADAWIDENSPTNNKGADSILKVQSKGPRDNFRALLRFSLPAVPQGCVVESATLRLYAASAKTGRTLHALRLTGAWSESQVTWSSQPQTSEPAATATSGQGYRSWNVTSHMDAMYGQSNHGFLIRDAIEGQDAEQQFHAREKGENAPQLVLRFAATPSAGAANVTAVAAAARPAGRNEGRDTAATPVALAGGTKKVRIVRGRVSVVLRMSCPIAETGGCKGTVTVVPATLRITASRAHSVLGSASFDLRGGERHVVRIRLRRDVARLSSRRMLAVQLSTVTRDAAGNAARKNVAMTLRIPGLREIRSRR